MRVTGRGVKRGGNVPFSVCTQPGRPVNYQPAGWRFSVGTLTDDKQATGSRKSRYMSSVRVSRKDAANVAL